ncbi:hypothetical protein DB345_13975 [Spartobacteria bacterium LR76]|nr:hypothetical protein DB345_13975 [Spartobacteria bacterium LR76]
MHSITRKVLGVAAVFGMVAFGCHAETLLNYIPGPDDTGGMVMPAVNFDISAKSVSVTLGGASSTVTMYSLQDYVVWGSKPYSDAVFNPAQSSAGWYSQLDPTQQNLPFSTRFGFYVTSGNVELLPTASYVYIKATSISPGLSGYDVGYYIDVWGQDPPSSSEWLQVYGEGSAYDNNIAWGDSSGISMWHPVFVASGLGSYSATFEIYVGDGYGNALSDWTSASITLNWVAVPEPSTWMLGVLGGMACLYFWRRRREKIASHQA